MYNRDKRKDDAEILPGLADGEVAHLMIDGKPVTWEGRPILPGSLDEAIANQQAQERDANTRRINNKS